MESISLKTIATVSNNRKDIRDDDWGAIISEITLHEDYSEALFEGLETFSHVEVIFVFHRYDVDRHIPATRHPRNNPEWPELGVLAQRSTHHPNPIGLTSAKILGIDGRILTVQGLDAVNGSPVLDIKPIYKEFLPNNPQQPQWVSELLKDYWQG